MDNEKGMSLTKEEKKKRREAKELERLRREQAKPKPKGYIAYFIFLISLLYIIDEVTSAIGPQMQSVLAAKLVAPVVGEDFAIARMSLITGTANMMGLVAFLYKPLADRYGRKKFLIINTIGMAMGMMFIGTAAGIPGYAIGIAIITFFIPHDMHAVYIFESVPAKHRAKIYAVIKAVAVAGALSIPLLRNLFMPGGDTSGWRGVYLVPMAAAFVVAVVAAFFIRESDAYVENRIQQLTMGDQLDTMSKKEKEEAQARGGIIKAVKTVFAHKQLRWLILASCIFSGGVLMTLYYEPTLNLGYVSGYIAEGMTQEAAATAAVAAVTKALVTFTVGSACIQLIQGFLSDSIGRKASSIIMAIAALGSFALFFVGANHVWNPYFVGLLAGVAVGGYYAACDINIIMISESTPTNLRSSVMTVQSITSMIVIMPVSIIYMIVVNLLGDAMIAQTCLIIAIPLMALGMLILWMKTKETKGTDMTNVQKNNFE